MVTCLSSLILLTNKYSFLVSHCVMTILVHYFEATPQNISFANATFAFSSSQLNKVAVKNLVIFTNINCGYSEFARNWAASLTNVGIRNFLIVVEDNASFAYLTHFFEGKHISRSPFINAYSGESAVDFGTEKLHARVFYLKCILSHGYYALLCDSDIGFFKNPLPYLPFAYDIVITDNARDGPSYLSHHFCSCFVFVNPNPTGVLFVDNWLLMLERGNPYHDQDPFNRAIQEMRRKNALVYLLLPNELFPNGDVGPMHENMTTWHHANYVIGHKDKKEMLKRKRAWFITDIIPPICRILS